MFLLILNKIEYFILILQFGIYSFLFRQEVAQLIQMNESIFLHWNDPSSKIFPNHQQKPWSAAAYKVTTMMHHQI